jgi:hypothetical protein
MPGSAAFPSLACRRGLAKNRRLWRSYIIIKHQQWVTHDHSRPSNPGFARRGLALCPPQRRGLARGHGADAMAGAIRGPAAHIRAGHLQAPFCPARGRGRCRPAFRCGQLPCHRPGQRDGSGSARGRLSAVRGDHPRRPADRRQPARGRLPAARRRSGHIPRRPLCRDPAWQAKLVWPHRRPLAVGQRRAAQPLPPWPLRDHRRSGDGRRHRHPDPARGGHRGRGAADHPWPGRGDGRCGNRAALAHPVRFASSRGRCRAVVARRSGALPVAGRPLAGGALRQHPA